MLPPPSLSKAPRGTRIRLKLHTFSTLSLIETCHVWYIQMYKSTRKRFNKNADKYKLKKECSTLTCTKPRVLLVESLNTVWTHKKNATKTKTPKTQNTKNTPQTQEDTNATPAPMRAQTFNLLLISTWRAFEIVLGLKILWERRRRIPVFVSLSRGLLQLKMYS